MSKIDEIRGKVPPEVEQKVDQAVKSFRTQHQHPANLALHAAGAYAILKGLARLARGKKFRAVFLVLFGIGMFIAGHEVEGNDAFSWFKEATGSGSGNGHRA